MLMYTVHNIRYLYRYYIVKYQRVTVKYSTLYP